MADEEDTEIEDGLDQSDEDGLAGSGSDGDQGAEDGAPSEADLSAEHAGNEGDEEQPQVARSRSETRIQRLANETKQARDEAAALRRQMAELQQRAQAGNQQLTDQQERERLALMTPEERMDYRIDKMQRQTQQQIAHAQFSSMDVADKAAYDAKASIHPTYARYADDVDRRLQELRAQGQNIPREQLLRWIIGDRALTTAPAARKKAQTEGKRRIEAQRVAPSNSKGDQANQRRKQGDTPESRLRDVLI